MAVFALSCEEDTSSNTKLPVGSLLRDAAAPPSTPDGAAGGAEASAADTSVADPDAVSPDTGAPPVVDLGPDTSVADAAPEPDARPLIDARVIPDVREIPAPDARVVLDPDARPTPDAGGDAPLACGRGPFVGQTELRGNAAGGQPYTLDCANGEVLVGVRGLARGALGGVAGLCQTVERHGDAIALVGPVVPTASVGNGEVIDSLCPPGHGVIGFSGRAGLLIDAIVPSCGPLVFVDQAVSAGPARVDAAPPAAGFDGGGNPFAPTACVTLAVGVFGGAGDSLDSFGLRCATLGCDRPPP